MEIKVKDYLKALDPHALVRLEWLDYAQSEESYNLWIQSPFANCIFMSAEYTLKNLINYYEFIGDMVIKGINEYDNYFKKSKTLQKLYKIQF